MTNDWPIPQDAVAYFRSIEKRLARNERRAAPVSATDLLGPGFSAKAVAIFDWEAEEATFNGFFYSEPGALHAPDAEQAWTGIVIGHEDGTGTQIVWDPQNPDSPRQFIRTFKPNPLDSDTSVFDPWKRFATPTGNIDSTVIDPPILADIQQALDDSAAAMNFAETPNKVFRQNDQPVSDASWTLRSGDVWFELDNDNHFWMYDGTNWIDGADAALAGMQDQVDQAAADAAQAASDAAAAQAAATAASDAAASKSKVYRQATKPTGGTYTLGDPWFDTDDGNRLYLWDPAAAGGAGDFVDATTAYLATNPNPTTGVHLSPSGLYAYNGTTATLSVDASGNIATTGLIATSGQVNGAIVTGGTVQTETTAARGIKMNSTGLTAYSGSGVPTFTVDAATGSVAMLGTLKSGSNIESATITSGFIKTNATASRGVEIGGSGIVAYDSTGNAKVTINGSTGLLTAYNGYFVGTVDASFVTGGTIQTQSDANRGVKMNSSGITAYDSVAGSPTLGQAMFTLSATTGQITSINVTGGSIVGATVSTSASANRGVKMSGSDFNIYNDSGVNLFHISGTSGYADMTGAVMSQQLFTNAIEVRDKGSGYAPGITVVNGGVDIQGGNLSCTNAALIDQIQPNVTSRVQITGGLDFNNGLIVDLYGMSSSNPNIQVTSGLSLNGNALNMQGGNINGCQGVALSGGNLTAAAGGEVHATGGLFQDGTQPTGGSSANAVAFGASGRVVKVGTSSRRFKKNIGPSGIDGRKVMDVVDYRFKYRAGALDETPEGWQYGFMLEDAVDLGFGWWAGEDEKGTPTTFSYMQWCVAQQAALRYLRDERDEMRAELDALREKIDSLV